MARLAVVGGGRIGGEGAYLAASLGIVDDGKLHFIGFGNPTFTRGALIQDFTFLAE